eukprot:TRINITY_DN44442_c0_g1_i1.p1 TRINITY_DN44442_c0_g1~~TRINITY_DN44442_c0_g1_i1.p1  ORF type:complete len:446 (-),score=48.53 TRINITY_DN44442_c0_g1_i1:13-1269(-)
MAVAATAAASEPNADKRCRWRKDRKDAPETAPGAPVALGAAAATLLGRRVGGGAQTSPSENKAAGFAFQGLHGRKNDFSLASCATDGVYKSVLGGNAYCYESAVCEAEDFSIYESLLKELDYKPCWMSGGTPLNRPTALGGPDALQRSPTYDRVIRMLAGYFGVEPVYSLVNHYRNGDDYTPHHSDQYYQGVNMTIGASFGEMRHLLFEHRESKERFSFPQSNGDIFAFTNQVNERFTHAVPKEKRRAHSASRGVTPGRVSVIMWGRQERPEWKGASAARLAISLQPMRQVTNIDPNAPSAIPEGSGEQASGTEVVEGTEAQASAATGAASAGDVGVVASMHTPQGGVVRVNGYGGGAPSATVPRAVGTTSTSGGRWGRDRRATATSAVAADATDVGLGGSVSLDSTESAAPAQLGSS